MSLAGAASLRLAALPAALRAEPSPLRAVARGLPTHGRALWPGDGPWRAIPDGNRGAVLPDVQVELDGRAWYLSVKGLGAARPLYGDGPGEEGLGGRRLWGESWFGEAPWGAQGAVGADTAAEVAERAGGACLAGLPLCPTLAVVELPEALSAEARGRWWYRRHRGPFLQEHRLVPSNVRLHDQAERTLGADPEGVLELFGVRGREALDAFVDRYLASGLAALTLFARTLRPGEHGLEGLVYDHVWLDKDAVLAPDGALHFADVEGLDRAVDHPALPVEEIVRKQFDDNWYELAAGLDALVRLGERRAGLRRTAEARRRDVALRIELAVEADPVIAADPGPAGLDLWVCPPAAPGRRARVRAVDLCAEEGA